MQLNQRAYALLEKYSDGLAQACGQTRTDRYFSLTDPKETQLRDAMLEDSTFLNLITWLDVDQIQGQVVNVGNPAAAQTQGVPDGCLSGDVAAEGEIELSSKAFAIVNAKARAAGSWRGIAPVDLMWYAKAGEEELKVEAFGCKLIVSDVLDVDPKGGSVMTHKIKFLVTSPDFVRLGGVPYLESALTQKLTG